MDASKALDALKTGDLYALAESLDADASVEVDLTFPCGVDRLRAYRIGRTVISIATEGHPGDGNLPTSQVYAYASEEEAQGVLDRIINGSQVGQMMCASLGRDGAVVMRVNGVVVPVMTPDLVHRYVGDQVKVTVPDDASSITDAI